MEIKHMSDREIQEYLSGSLEISDESNLHIQNCEQCRKSVLFYQNLFFSIETLEDPLTNLNLANDVLSAIEKSHIKPKVSYSNITLLYGVAGFILVCLAVYKVYNTYFQSSSNTLILSLVIVAVCITGFQIFDMLKSYKEKYMELFKL